jgi:hypothetical protein
MAKAWAPFPFPEKSFVYTPAALKKAWDRLHRGDAEPLPKEAAALEAWIAYHAGDFQKAVTLGLKAGPSGMNAANKAQCVYANYLEPSEKRQLELYQEVGNRCEALQAEAPKNPNAYYLYAYAMGRYSQGISIAKALAQGLGGKIKTALDTCLQLQPAHADAHIALGAYHAEIIDKIGAMIGGLTYGAKKEAGLEHFRTALKLNPESAIGRIEYADGLVMLEGKKALAEAERLYDEAAKFDALDAMERLDVERARIELED